jgi:hypothetical protein
MFPDDIQTLQIERIQVGLLTRGDHGSDRSFPINRSTGRSKKAKPQLIQPKAGQGNS